jgi:hypothetical protein
MVIKKSTSNQVPTIHQSTLFGQQTLFIMGVGRFIWPIQNQKLCGAMAPFAELALDTPHPPDSPPASAEAPAATSTNAGPPTSSSPTFSPHAPPFIPQGRSKEERWKDDGSPPTSPGKSFSSKSLVASHHDVLLAHCPSAGVPIVAGMVVTTMLDPHAPRGQAPTTTHPPASSWPMDDGWQLVESRKSQQ